MGNPPGIQLGDTVTIAAQGIKVKGEVAVVNHWSEGWDIELTNANVPGGYSRWKQWQDGGRIVSVNDRIVQEEGAAQ